MEIRNRIILLLCLVSAAILITGCTSQTSGTVTTEPTTMVTIPVITLTSGTVVTTGTIDTTTTTGTISMSKTSISTNTPGTPTATSTDDRSERVRIKARNFAFDVSRITVSAGKQVTVEFENEDSAPHNVAFYTTPSLTSTIYKGKIITGPDKITYIFTAPSIPGIYYFRCDLHPSMQGQFVVV